MEGEAAADKNEEAARVTDCFVITAQLPQWHLNNVLSWDYTGHLLLCLKLVSAATLFYFAVQYKHSIPTVQVWP